MATPQPQTATTPLAEFLPYFLSFVKGVFSLCISFVRLVGQFSSLLLHLSPLPYLPGIVLYVLAPVILVLNALLHLLVWNPFNILLYLLDALYPLYAFGGAACIIGGLLGWAGQHAIALFVSIALHTPDEGKQVYQKSMPVSEIQPAPTTPKSKGKAREIVREKKLRGRRLSKRQLKRSTKDPSASTDSTGGWKTATESE